VTGLVGAVSGLLALLVAGWSHRRLRRRGAGPGGPGVEPALASLRSDLAGAVRHVGVVRYDALGDVTGRLSWSLALVDDRGDGVVLTTIRGRQDAHSYAKPLHRGRGEDPLSPEERRAVAAALRPVGASARTARAAVPA
jgi:hypothetical protein